MIQAIRDHVNARWSALRPGAPRPSGAILAGADREESAKVAFIFFDELGHPAAVAKVGRSRAAEKALQAEAAALKHFWSLGCQTVRGHAPEPLLLDRIGDHLVFLMTTVPGTPMITRYYTPGHAADPQRVAADFDAAGSWLVQFHRETLSDVEPFGTETFDRFVGAVFDRYRQEVGWSAVEEELMEALTERARRLRGALLPLTGVHGDFWMGNLFVDGPALGGVVDWELAQAVGHPLTDLYKFPTSYGFYLDRATAGADGSVPGHPERAEHRSRWRPWGTWRNLPGFGYTYFGRGWFPEQARRFVLRHLAALGIPRAINGVFFPTFLAAQATVLDVPEFREGYRSLLLAFASERTSTWLWADGGAGAEIGKGRARVG